MGIVELLLPYVVPQGVSSARLAAELRSRSGPTLAIQIARRARFARAGLSVRLTPAHDAREAAASRLK